MVHSAKMIRLLGMLPVECGVVVSVCGVCMCAFTYSVYFWSILNDCIPAFITHAAVV